jgi:hypothetical protein
MRYLVLPVLSVLWLLTSAASAQEPFTAVLDDAKLFNDKTIAEADRILLDVLRKHHFHVVIETRSTVPKQDVTRVERMHRGDALRYFREWAKQRAVAEKVDGLYILICRNPGHVSVLPWPEAHDADLSDDDCEQLRKTFVNTNRRKKANAALLALVGQVRAHLNHVAAPTDEDASSVAWTTVLAVVAGNVLLWLILCLIRIRIIARSGEAAEEREQTYLPARVGGMFGNPASQWIYDTLFVQCERSTEAPASQDAAPRPELTNETGQATEPAPKETSATSTER